MPRIDPQQLLDTLKVLLSSEGGIKSSSEVTRISTLMQKFSTKLVSKCIYVQILKATTPDLLKEFLDKNGWNLINTWLSDAFTMKNWAFCHEIIILLTKCDINIEYLKSDSNTSSIPHIINLLKNDSCIDEESKKIASYLDDNWNRMLRESNTDEKENLKADYSNEIKDESEGSISLLKSLAEEVSESIKKEESKQEEKIIKQSSNDVKKEKKESRHKSSKDEKKSSSKDKSKDKDSNSKSSSRSRDERRRHRNDPKDEKERKRFRVDRRDEVDPMEKQRIKEIARRLKAEDQAKKDKETLKKVGGSSTLGLSKIPKIPKKTDDKKKANTSFEEMLGGLDNKPKTVKTPLNKNKTASLLAGLTKTSTTSKDSKHKHHDSKHSHKKHSSTKKDSSSSSPHSHKDSSKKDDKVKVSPLHIPEKKKNTELESPKNKSPHYFSDSSGFMDALNSSIGGDTRRRKRRISETNDSTKKQESPKAKISKDPETEEKKDDITAGFTFYRDTLDTPTEETKSPTPTKSRIKEGMADDEDDIEASEKSSSDKEPDAFDESSSPREVKGILVYHRGSNKRNKAIKWKTDKQLVAVRYFDIEEGERVNVNKMKFENMRDMELKLEKAAIKSKVDIEEEQINTWYIPIKIKLPPNEIFVPGNLSKEREVQATREKSVLQALYFNKALTPSSPAEPDPETFVGSHVALTIPLYDQTDDCDDSSERNFANADWPQPIVNDVDTKENFASTFSLPPALTSLLGSFSMQNILPNSNPSLSQEDQSILAAQTEALKALGMPPNKQSSESFNSAPNMPLPPPNMGGGQHPPHGNSSNGPPPNNFQGNSFNSFNNQGPPPGPQGFNNGPPHPMRNNGDNFNPFQGNQQNMNNGPPNNMNGPPNRGFPDFHRGRGNFTNGRGFHAGRGNFRGSFNRERDFHNRNNDHKIKTKPCLFYAKGFCRDGDRCRFIHEDSGEINS